MIGDIFAGTVQAIGANIGKKERLAKRDAAQVAYDRSIDAYFNQDTSNLYGNMENTMEDLTVNTQAANFAAQQQAQGLSNTLGQLNQSSGGSGVAALAQAIANQQSQNAVTASASIGQQEAANQRAAAGMAGQIQNQRLAGEERSRALKGQLLGERFQIDAGQLATSEAAIQAAKQAQIDGIARATGGVGDLAGQVMGLPTEQLGQMGQFGVNAAKLGELLGYR
jgi:hypothetical protein